MFQGTRVDALIVNSAGCGAAMREAPQWIADEGVAYAGMVRDVCEFLAEVGLRSPGGRIDARVCYDDPWHLVHGQKDAEAHGFNAVNRHEPILAQIIARQDPCAGLA